MIFLLLSETMVIMHESIHQQISGYYGDENATIDIRLWSGVTHTDISMIDDVEGFWLAQSMNEVAYGIVSMLVLLWLAGKAMRVLE